MIFADQQIRRNWRATIFGSVAALSDLAFQKATWLDPEMENPAYTFVEFYESFYDACAGGYNETDPGSEKAPFRFHLQNGYLSTEERDVIWPLHLALMAYDYPDDNYDHESILADSGWQRVVAVASDCTGKLRKMQTDPLDIESLSNALPANKKWP